LTTSDYRYIAAFDLDKTILSVNSSKVTVIFSKKAGVMRSRDYLQALFFSLMYKMNISDPNKLVVSMAMWLKGLNENIVKDLVNEAILPELKTYIRQELIRETEFHKKQKGKVILLSSALNYVCQPLAETLEMDDVICSEMEIVNGTFTGRPKGRLVFGQEKINRMKSYCRDHHFSLEEAWYYGDSFSDRYILEGVGNAVCVSPDKKLKKLALNKGWRVI